MNINYSNLPIQPSSELLLDGAAECFLALADALEQSDVLTYADSLTMTLAANSLFLYKGIVEDLGASGTNGQTVTDNVRNKSTVIIKKDQRVEALSRVQKDLLSLLDRLLLPPNTRLKLILANPVSKADASYMEFMSL